MSLTVAASPVLASSRPETESNLTEIEKLQSFLDAVTKTGGELNVVALQNFVKEWNGHAEFPGKKELFSSLKFNYVELESKKRFLEGIASKSPLKAVDQDAFSSLEAQFEQEQQAVKQSKKENAQTKEEIEHLISVISNNYEAYNRELKTATSQMDALQQLQPAENDDSIQEQLQPAENDDSIQEAQLEAQLNVLRAEVSELEEKNANNKRSRADSQAGFLSEINTALSTLGGVSVSPSSDDSELCLRLRISQDNSNTLTVHYADSHRNTIVNATLETPVCSIEDIVKQAAITGDLVLLVSETKHRLACMQRRLKDVVALSESYGVKDNEETLTTDIVLNGSVYTFKSSYDYGTEYCSVTLDGVVEEDGSVWEAGVLKLQALMVEAKPTTLEDAIVVVTA